MKITVKNHTVTTEEKEIQLPYFTKGKYKTYYKIFGEGNFDCIAVQDAGEIACRVYNTVNSNAVGEDEVQITEDEFNQQYYIAVEYLTNMFNASLEKVAENNSL